MSSPALLEHAAALAAHASRCEVIPFGLDVDPRRRPTGHPSVGAVREPVDRADCALRRTARALQRRGRPAARARARRRGRGHHRRRTAARVARALARELGVESRVFFLGAVDDEAVAAWYGACDMFVLPSVTRAEAFGLVQLEAMARGEAGDQHAARDRRAVGERRRRSPASTVPPGDSGGAGRGAADARQATRRCGANGRGGARCASNRSSRATRMIDRTVAMYERRDDRARAVAAAADEARVRHRTVRVRPDSVGAGVGAGRGRHQARGRRAGVLPPATRRPERRALHGPEVPIDGRARRPRPRAASGVGRRCAGHPRRPADARHRHGRAAAARQHLQRGHELRRPARADAGRDRDRRRRPA